MSIRIWLVVLIGGLAAATLFALERSPASAAPVARETPAAAAGEPPPEDDPAATEGALPPGHPPIDDPAASVVAPAPDDEAPALTWTAPAGWQTVPNPSPMRLATYRPPPASGDVAGAEMSVVRAGGSVEANIDRWRSQFEDAGALARTHETVRGLEVTIVETSGTYLAGAMMPGSDATPHPGWALLGAIVETRGLPYFFKLVGPRATVASARRAFDALVASLTPS